VINVSINDSVTSQARQL